MKGSHHGDAHVRTNTNDILLSRQKVYFNFSLTLILSELFNFKVKFLFLKNPAISHLSLLIEPPTSVQIQLRSFVRPLNVSVF